MTKAERFEDFHARLREFQAKQFAQRVSPMQPVEQADAVQVVLMEAWLDDELKCEVIHEQGKCSVHVTHRLVFCKKATLMCAAAARQNEDRMLAGDLCTHCKKPAASCWRLVPV